MAGARCLTVPGEDPVLVEAWIRYHAYQFGFEGLTVYRPGEVSDGVAALLRRAERAGMSVRLAGDGPVGVDGLIDRWRQEGASREIAISLAPGEFLAVQTEDGVSCRRDRIAASLDLLRDEWRAMTYAPGLVQTDGARNAFAIAPFGRLMFPAGVTGAVASGPKRSTALTCVRVVRPLEVDVSLAADGPRVVFQGLACLLDALGIRNQRFGTPVARPRAGPDDTVWISTAADVRPVRFKAEAYRRAHADVAASGWPPFIHYASFGLRENRRLG